MNPGPDRAPVWAIWLLIAFGAVQPLIWTLPAELARRPLVRLPILVCWLTLLVLAAIATRRITWLWRTLSQKDRAHRATLNEVQQLQTQNAMLETIARSVDVPLAFQELASRIAQLVPCDRVGLALLSEGGGEFQTYTARAEMADRRVKTRPEVTFRTDRTLIGTAVRLREPVVIRDLKEVAPDHLDANVVASAGFRSSLIVPLISTDRAVGTLSIVSRQVDAFSREHADVLMPIAEILAVAWVAEQLQVKMSRLHTVEAMSEQMLAVSSEINSALQTIIGHCDLLARQSTVAGTTVNQDLATVIQQAQRIADLLEKMREGARQRLKEATDGMSDPGALRAPDAAARNRV